MQIQNRSLCVSSVLRAVVVIVGLFVLLAPGYPPLMVQGEESPRSSTGASIRESPANKKQRAIHSFGRLPLYFIENQGQLDRRVAYYIQGSRKNIYFTSHGLIYVLTDRRRVEARRTEVGPPRFQPASLATTNTFESQAGSAVARWVVKQDFVVANPEVRPQGQTRTKAVVSYFRGPSEKSKSGVPTYCGVLYENLWPGIDLAYSGEVNELKYTFSVKPGADPGFIRLAYRGAGVELNDGGQLEVTTPAGRFRDDRPFAYQETETGRQPIAVSYRLDEDGGEGKRVYGFQLGDYDPSRTLVIDPAVLVYAGYIGGSGDDEAEDVAVDADGNVYVAGRAASSEASFPVTAGPDLSWGGGENCGFFPNLGPCPDAFVAKLSAEGELVYAGYIGGSRADGATGIAVDAEGNAYLVGTADSTETTFPVTGGPDLTHNKPSDSFSPDAFVAKVNADGTALLYAGYIGGAEIDQGWDIAVDGSGNAYITGTTNSTQSSFPVTVGPDLIHEGGAENSTAFVAKVTATGEALEYAGYIGSRGETGNGIAVDGDGNAYVTGSTFSKESFPVTVGPDLTENDGPSNFNGDAFVAKVRADGSGFVYAGFIGGSSTDIGTDIAVDGAGSAYVVGQTGSDQTSFPVTVGPSLIFNGGSPCGPPPFAGACSDGFVAKVTADGTTLAYAGYIGGAESESTFVDFGTGGIAIDGIGNAYVTGVTFSPQDSFPVTNGPDLTFNGGESCGRFPSVGSCSDAFVAQVNPSGTGLIFAGYIGGSEIDEGRGITVDDSGNVYVVGATSSGEGSFPVAVGPDLTSNGGIDAFVAKITQSVEAPQISGVLNAASSAQAGEPGHAMAPGSIVSVFGTFATVSANATTVPLSTELGGISITFDGIAGHLFAVIRGDTFDPPLGFDQANVQIPWELDPTEGTATVVLERDDMAAALTSSRALNGSFGAQVASDPAEIQVAPASPGIFTFEFGPGPAIVQNLDGSFAQPEGSLGELATRPAEVGGVITLWCNGLGEVSPAIATGDVPGVEAPLSETTNDVRAFIGDVEAAIVERPVLHPVLVGLNQINAVVPTAPSGDEVPIQIEVDAGDGNVVRSREDVTIAVGTAP